jgi:hypothetical protein
VYLSLLVALWWHHIRVTRERHEDVKSIIIRYETLLGRVAARLATLGAELEDEVVKK